MLFADMPNEQKTFYIHVPVKYKMILPIDIAEKIMYLQYEGTPSSRQSNYVLDMRGPILKCGLLTISSENMCIYAYSKDGECFSSSENDIQDNEDSEDSEESRSSDDAL